jgi:CRP-like cAMP-binding protein
MMEVFKNHLAKFIEIEEDEFLKVVSYFKVKKVRKKENLLIEGKVCRHTYFVLDGCLRKYFVNERGVEQTTEFAIENWWITDNFAFERQLKTDFFIQAIEHSTILQIDYFTLEQLLREHPVMEHYFRMIYQRAYASAERRIRMLYEFTREELYVHFATHYPEFVRRVPQYLLASFLGFTPEYLSEIKNKMRS